MMNGCSPEGWKNSGLNANAKKSTLVVFGGKKDQL